MSISLQQTHQRWFEDFYLHLQDNEGRTPLMIACLLGNEEAVRRLVIMPDIDLYCTDDRGLYKCSEIYTTIGIEYHIWGILSHICVILYHNCDIHSLHTIQHLWYTILQLWYQSVMKYGQFFQKKFPMGILKKFFWILIFWIISEFWA